MHCSALHCASFPIHDISPWQWGSQTLHMLWVVSRESQCIRGVGGEYRFTYSTSQKFGHTFSFNLMRRCVQTFDWYCTYWYSLLKQYYWFGNKNKNSNVTFLMLSEWKQVVPFFRGPYREFARGWLHQLSSFLFTSFSIKKQWRTVTDLQNLNTGGIPISSIVHLSEICHSENYKSGEKEFMIIAEVYY